MLVVCWHRAASKQAAHQENSSRDLGSKAVNIFTQSLISWLFISISLRRNKIRCVWIVRNTSSGQTNISRRKIIFIMCLDIFYCISNILEIFQLWFNQILLIFLFITLLALPVTHFLNFLPQINLIKSRFTLKYI
jgi:hypothetical protein